MDNREFSLDELMGDMQKEYMKITFESEDGEEDFYIIEQTMLGGVNYLLVTNSVDDDDEDGGFLILKEGPEDEDGFSSYDILDDEKELKSIVQIFNEIVEGIDLEV